MHEQGGSSKIREMLRSQFLGLARWMQRIGKQQESIHQPGRFGGKHTRLPAAIRMTAQPYTLRLLVANLEDLFAQSLPVSRRIARPRRAIRPFLAKREIVAQHLDVRCVKSVLQRYQKWRIPIRSSAVREK